MKIIRTIETFYPYVCGPAKQAFQISKRLLERGIESPVHTTYCDIEESLPNRETVDGVEIHRFKNQARLMRYCMSFGMARSLKNYDIIHSHNYRNFQSDMSFFFPEFMVNPSYLVPMDLSSVLKDTSPTGAPNFPIGFMISCPLKSLRKRRIKSLYPPNRNMKTPWNSA